MKRSLKVYEVMDFRRHKVKPTIILSGKWLAEAGFPPNKRITVQSSTSGELVIALEKNHDA